MRRLLIVAVLTVLQHLILDPFRSECLADSFQASATARLLSYQKNPIEGTLGAEQSNIRFSVSLGNNDQQSYALDVLKPFKDGLYVGGGLFLAGEPDVATTVVSRSDTTVTKRHGKHKGDKHKHHNKTITMISETTTVKNNEFDLDLRPTILLGISERRLFVESRLIFGGEYDVENRTSIGVRF